MRASAPTATPATTRFSFVGGDPSTDFVNTADWTPGGVKDDQLRDYAALTHWAEQRGVLSSAVTARLRQLATTQRTTARAVLSRARELRSVLYRIFAAVADERRPHPADLDALNRTVTLAYRHLALAPAASPDALPPARVPAMLVARMDDPALAWTWRAPEQDLAAVLWPVARAAAALLTSPGVRRIRLCPGTDCGWAYVDRSRNGHRRWCEMRTCGARAKARRYYARQQA